MFSPCIWLGRMEKLIGQELLSKMAAMNGASKAEQATAAGYIRFMDDGSQKADFTAFYSALLDAKEHASVDKENPQEARPETGMDPSSLEYWSSLDEDQIEFLLCCMEGAVPPVAMIPKLALSSNPSIRESVAELIETPEQTLLLLFNDEEASVREAASLSLARIATGKRLPKHDFLRVIGSEEIDPDEVKKIFSLGNEELQSSLASNSKINEECLEELLATQPVDWLETLLRQNLAQRRLPESFVAMDEQSVVRLISDAMPEQSVLENLVFLFLDSSDFNGLCFFLAQNIDTPADILELLAVKGDSLVKRQVAMNTSVPKHVIEVLACDQDARVRQAMAKNELTPLQIVERLSLDPSTIVRSAAGLRLLPVEWQNLERDALLNKLQTNPISETILRLFMDDGDLDCLISIGKNPYVSEAIQRELASNPDPGVVLELISNPATTDSVIHLISKEWNFYEPIKSSLAKRQLPADISALGEDELADYIVSGGLDRSLATYLFRTSGYSIKRAIMQSDVLNETEKQLLVDQYHQEIYPKGSLGSLLFTDLEQKGWIIMAVSTYVVDNKTETIALDANACVMEDARKLLELASGTRSCWSSSFVYEGSASCSPLFFVVEPSGDCLISLVSHDESNRKDYKDARLFARIEDALASVDPVHATRVFSCLAFTYSEFEATIDEEDLGLEESVDDGEYFANFPTISKGVEDGLDVYFKPHPAHGDPDFVTRLEWESGELTEEEKLPNKMSPQLQGVRVGNPFAIYLL